jgi:DNA-binding transcriptional MerR regulator
MENDLLHTAKAAALVGLHPETLRRLNNIGVVPAKRNWRGHRVFIVADLLKFKAGREKLSDPGVLE